MKADETVKVEGVTYKAVDTSVRKGSFAYCEKCVAKGNMSLCRKLPDCTVSVGKMIHFLKI